MVNIEKSLEELQNIVTALASGDVSLPEALELYQRGVELQNACALCLLEAEQKISSLTEELFAEHSL